MDSEYQQRVPPTASNRQRRELDVDHERDEGAGEDEVKVVAEVVIQFR